MKVTTEAAFTRSRGVSRSYRFGKALYRKGGRFGPRLQRMYQLVILTRGELCVTVSGVPYDVRPGEGILLKPGKRELFRFSSVSESEHTWCQIPARSFSQRETRMLLSIEGVFPVPTTANVLVEEGLAGEDLPDRASQVAGMALARACLLGFAADAINLGKRVARPLHPALARAKEIAGADFTCLQSAEDLAFRAGISYSRLRSLWQEAFGESPSEFLRRMRIEHAIHLLRSTGCTLAEIADQCGFSNPFYLSRAVKQFTGLSPRELRKRAWATQE